STTLCLTSSRIGTRKRRRAEQTPEHRRKAVSAGRAPAPGFRRAVGVNRKGGGGSSHQIISGGTPAAEAKGNAHAVAFCVDVEMGFARVSGIAHPADPLPFLHLDRKSVVSGRS